MDPSDPHRHQQQSTAWSPGQAILNSTGVRVPEHRFDPPVRPWRASCELRTGEERFEAEALGSSGRNGYVRVPDRRYPSRRCGWTPWTFCAASWPDLMVVAPPQGDGSGATIRQHGRRPAARLARYSGTATTATTMGAVNGCTSQAEARIAAAIVAGGRLVTDQHAPAWCTLADAKGNEADIATWMGRD